MAITEKEINIIITSTRLIRSEYELQRIPIEVENELKDKIRQGKYNEIHLHPFSQLGANLGPMANNPMTQFTYLVVASISGWSRIVIDCGVNPDDVFDLSDALLYSLSFCKTLDEIHDVYQLAATMFAKQVHEQKQKKTSYQIMQAQNYISRNIFKKITLDEIAEYVGLSSNYLCNLFSREMGMSLHNYIQREKVSIACNLLMHTKRPISDIATYMGFQTQSNFTAVFRKQKGMTPTEFREQNYKEVF